MRIKHTLGLTCAAALCIVAMPNAHAVDIPGLSVDEADSVMLNSRDATKLGIAKKRHFGYFATVSGIPVMGLTELQIWNQLQRMGFAWQSLKVCAWRVGDWLRCVGQPDLTCCIGWKSFLS